MAAIGAPKRVNGSGTFQGLPHQDPTAIWSRFQIDSERCRSRFAKLAKLPEWGGGPWQEFYAEAFQEYNKLWSTQQRHRAQLTQAGLTRWAIGEIASKIGQLYYNYYARKSDTAALVESAAFYDAIRTRQYFEGAEESMPLLLQRLRYHARYALVCLLLQDLDTASLVASSMQALALQLSSAMCSRGNSPTLAEWVAVAGEAWACIDAETLVPKKSPLAEVPAAVPRRLSLSREADAYMAVVSHAVIITSRPNQLKIGALTLEALRLSQALEWEPPAAQNGGRPASACCPRSPRKLIFHQAGASRIHSALAATVDAMAPNKVLLIYLSADAWPFRQPTSPPARPATPPASPQQPQQPPVWTPGAVTLVETGVALMAPLPFRPQEGGTAADTAALASLGPDAALDTSATGEGGLMGLSASNSGVLTGTAGADTQESAAHTALARILPSVQAGPQWPKRPPPRRTSSQALVAAEAGGSCRDGAAALEALTASAGAELQSMELPSGMPPRRLSHMSSGGREEVTDNSGRAAPEAEGSTEILGVGAHSARPAAHDSRAAFDGADVALPPSPEHILAPSDFVPATRRPLLLIINSDRAAAFVRLQELALGPLPLLLLKPETLPDPVRRAATVESVFAMFLSDPVLALVRLFGLNATPELVDELQAAVEQTLTRAREAIAPNLPHVEASFAGGGSTDDDGYAVAPGGSPWGFMLLDLFAQRLVLRFALCRAVFARTVRLRRSGGGGAAAAGTGKGSGFGDIAAEGSDGAAASKHAAMLPRALPELPAELGPFADALSEDVDVLLRVVCKVDY